MMMIQLEQSDAIQLMDSVGNQAWFLYWKMRYLAIDSVVNLTLDEIADATGISKSAIQRYLKKLKETPVGEGTLVRAERTAEGNSYVVLEFTTKQGPVKKPKRQQKAASPTNELFNYWLAKYNEAYGSPYPVSNFGKEKKHVRELATRYNNNIELVKAIMDVVIRLYPSRWKSPQFTRPTLGALHSWIAAQAEPLAKANIEVDTDPEIVITNEDGVDVFAVYDKAWGFDE
jgi:DNA-binding transcriptional regulator GbsR (MarR family)